MQILNFFKFSAYVILAFLFFFIAGLYTYYRYKIPEQNPINSKLYDLYPTDILLKTGGNLYQPQIRLQHFLNFPAQKKKGTIRIGAFGDSHTFGSEVEKTSSYPYYLQKLFDARYPNHPIEVLNFGVGGAGFPEQFFLWEKYAKQYHLDYILLGPSGVYSERNTRFTFHDMAYWFPKNRWILSKSNQLKEIHIKGTTLQERFRNYYKLIPTWTALRYDKQPFKLYEILFPFLRYKIKNPFYYTKMSEHEEAVKINKQLLKRINKVYPKKILFFTTSKGFYQHYSHLNEIYKQSIGNLYNLNLIPSSHGFYEVFWHESSLGNEITALIYFNALLGNTNFFLNTIQCYFKENKSISTQSAWKLKNRDSIEKIKVVGGSQLIFNLKANRSDHSWNNKFFKEHPMKNAKSFLAFLNKKQGFLKSVYIPLPFQLKEGMKLYIQFKNKNRIELGSIQALDTYNNFFAFYSDHITGGVDYSYTYWIIYLLKTELKINKKEALFIENYKLGDIVMEKRFFEKKWLKFIPTVGYSNTFLVMGPQDKVTEKDFPEKFSVYMSYETKDGNSFKSLIPDWTCKKEKQKINLDLPNFQPLVFKSDI